MACNFDTQDMRLEDRFRWCFGEGSYAFDDIILQHEVWCYGKWVIADCYPFWLHILGVQSKCVLGLVWFIGVYSLEII